MAFRLITNRKRSGFTLIEVVVAVAIFAVISSIIFPALIQFLDARERILEKNHQVTELQKFFLYLERDLRFASNRLGKDEYGDALKSAMTVNDGSLFELTAVYPDLRMSGVGVPRRVKWELIDGHLIRTQYPVMDPDGDTRVNKRAFLEDIDDVEIIVHYIEDGRSSETKRWSESKKLPDLIQLRLEMKNKIVYERHILMLSGATSD
ncbi:MAG TPA: hypothetical protein DCW52_10865 [Gammaproteobacteria bacterium]|jgi:general secretion pathway protein J|nr:hypothetical protein [Gammaproteobacteria bacterium]